MTLMAYRDASSPDPIPAEPVKPMLVLGACIAEIEKLEDVHDQDRVILTLASWFNVTLPPGFKNE